MTPLGRRTSRSPVGYVDRIPCLSPWQQVPASCRQTNRADVRRRSDSDLQGSWAGKGAKKAKNARKFIKKIDGVDASERKDAKMNHVIISERKDKKAAKYMLKDLPFPYTSAAQHEHKLRTPMGPEWSTSTVRLSYVRRLWPFLELTSLFVSLCVTADLAGPDHSGRPGQARCHHPAGRSQSFVDFRKTAFCCLQPGRLCLCVSCCDLAWSNLRKRTVRGMMALEAESWRTAAVAPSEPDSGTRARDARGRPARAREPQRSYTTVMR